jgi:hypothetical protein
MKVRLWDGVRVAMGLGEACRRSGGTFNPTLESSPAFCPTEPLK